MVETRRRGKFGQVAFERKGHIASPNEYLMPEDLSRVSSTIVTREEKESMGALRVILFLGSLLANDYSIRFLLPPPSLLVVK